MRKYCYFNGKFILEQKAKINLRDIGILRGYGIFDFLRTYNGKIFLFDQHFERFKNSAKFLNILLPLSKKEFLNIFEKLLKKNKLTNAFFRIILTGGVTTDPAAKTYDFQKPTFYILVDAIKELPKKFYQKGVKLITYNYQREFPPIKSLNYLAAIKTSQKAKQKGAFGVLYVWNNYIREGTNQNFFVFKKNKLLTPKKDILDGTTKNFVIFLARPYFKIEQREIKIQELKDAQESFLTSTFTEILPVVKVDNTKIGNGKVGKKTKFLMKLFYDYTCKF